MKCPNCGSKILWYKSKHDKYCCNDCKLEFLGSDALTDNQISRREGDAHIG